MEKAELKMVEVPCAPLKELAGGKLVYACLGQGECEGQLVLNEVKIDWETKEYLYGAPDMQRWYIPLSKEIPLDRTVQ